MHKFALVLAVLAAVCTTVPAAAQGAETLAENMKLTLAGCMDSQSYGFYTNSKVFLEDQCAAVTFRVLQTYVDVASACIDNPTEGDACARAKILEEGLIKTFQQPTE